MKRYSILALALVLSCTLFTGCRRGNGNMATIPPTTQAATQAPTTPATMPSTHPETRPAATLPTDDTIHSTESTETDGTESATGDTQPSSRVLRPNTR